VLPSLMVWAGLPGGIVTPGECQAELRHTQALGLPYVFVLLNDLFSP